MENVNFTAPEINAKNRLDAVQDVIGELKTLREEMAGMKKAQTEFKNATSYSYSPGYTFPGNLPTELYYAPTLGSSITPLSDIFTIRQGIRTDEYLVLVNTLEKLLVATTGCSPSYTTAGTLGDRKLSVGKFSANLQWCKSDFISTASALSNDPAFVANGLDGYEVTSKVREMWVRQMIDGMKKDIFRIAWFGNDAAASANYNVIDGLLVKLYDGGSAYCVKRVNNTLPNGATQALAADDALNAIRGLYQGAAYELRSVPQGERVIWTVGTMAENLMTSYESKTSGSELQYTDLQNGIKALKFRGIDIRWDYTLDNYLEDSTNPWFNNTRNFAIMTPKASSRMSNLILGTEKAADLDRVDVFYDQRLLTTFAQSEVRFGVNYIQCLLTAFTD